MHRVHKIALKPNNKQLGMFAKSAGVARFSYNWALAEWKSQYESGLKPNEMALRKKFNSLKKQEFQWCYDVTKNAPQQAIKNLGMAFNRFFKKQSKFPKFKKKGVHDSFRADNGNNDIVVKDKKIKLPRIGWVRLREPVRFAGQIKSAVVSRKAGKWFVALSFELEDQPCTHENQGVVGVDLGVKTMAVCSNGMVFDAPKPLSKRMKALRRAQRILSRRQKQSANWKKAAARVAKLHYKVSCIRSDALHKATTAICRSAYVIVLEDLNIKGMMRNRKLSRAISDIGMYEFYRQCEYKAREIYTVPRFFASSKTCSGCGELNQNLTLSVRDWTCDHCGSCHDRDANAAKNLEQYYTVRSAGINACGETGADALETERETGLAEARNKPHS